MDAAEIPVLVEEGAKRVFVRAADWPGLTRSGRDVHAAMDALADAVPRYRAVLAAAGSSAACGFPPADPAWTVMEQRPGSATTDFGAPGEIFAADHRPLAGADLRRWVDILEASWRALDAIGASASPSLRKGPRGGGRDRDAIVLHVAEAERSYGPKFGVRLPVLWGDAAVHRAGRAQLVAALRDEACHPQDPAWPVRTLLHRMTWHVLDHVWEIEDRSDGG